jgi:pyruvate-formate lyase
MSTNTSVKDKGAITSARIKKCLKIKEQVHPFNPKDPSSKTVTDKLAMLQGRYTPILGEEIDENSEDLVLDQLEIDCCLRYPPADEDILPSSKEGFKFDLLNWARDYEELVKAAPLEIFPYEEITGKLHWRLYTCRKRLYKNLDKIRKLRKKAWEHGAGALVWNRTCPDLSFGLKHGWGGIKEIVAKKQLQFEKEGKKQEGKYLEAAGIVCGAIMTKIKQYSDMAKRLALAELDSERQERYERLSKTCLNISSKAPETFQEAVQWIHFFIMFNKVIGECDGPVGRIDQLLIDFYRKDIKDGILTPEKARDMIAELFIHLDPWLTIGGRKKDMSDGTNEVSWRVLEAYDSLKGFPGNFAVMWHQDMDENFLNYACDVNIRLQSGAPMIVNQDMMRESLINQGIKKSDAWNVCHNGCGWYSVPGKQYLTGDWCSINLAICLMKAFWKSADQNVKSFDQFYQIYSNEVKTAADALNQLVNAYLAEAPEVWPEIVVSLSMPDCIERGKDVSAGGVPYYEATVQIIGFANAVNSLYAIKQVVFEDKKFSLKEFGNILDKNYKGSEDIRQYIVNLPKFGNDDDAIDKLACKSVDELCEILKSNTNMYGGKYYPLLWSHVGHVYIGKEMGATPDGRIAGQTLAQGGNPSHGSVKEGLTAHARSMAKLNFKKLDGCPLQMELDTSILKTGDPAKQLASIIKSYFGLGGQHVEINIHTVKDFIQAMKTPEKYQNLVVRVTGFSSRFVSLKEEIQREIIARQRYNAR